METVASAVEEWGKKLMLMRLHSIDIYSIYFKCFQVRILQRVAYIYGAYDDGDVLIQYTSNCLLFSRISIGKLGMRYT